MPTPLSPKKIASLVKQRLRYFTYYPPLGGFGGDFDQLDAEVTIRDRVALEQLLRAMGQSDPMPWDGDVDLGVRPVGDSRVGLRVRRFKSTAKEWVLQIMIGIYISEADIKTASDIEQWLQRAGVAPPLHPPE